MRRIRAFGGISLLLIDIAAYSAPISYTFTSGDPINVDPLLTAVTSVSGSFIYDADAPLVATEASSGNSIYAPWSALSGDTAGDNFSAVVGAAIVGNDTFSSGEIVDADFYMLVSSSTPGTLNAFSLDGMELRSVRIFWIEGQNGIPDFLDDQSLPSALPPTVAGTLALDFFGPDEVAHRAFFFVTIEAEGPADTHSIGWSGALSHVETDTGGGVYSGTLLGTGFEIEMNLTTTVGLISDGMTTTRFSVEVSNGSPIRYTDDLVVEAEDADWVNAVAGTSFAAGDVVDIVEFEGTAATEAGGRIYIGVVDVVSAAAFSGVGPTDYPPDPKDVLTRVFWIDQTTALDDEVYSAGGIVDAVDPPGSFDDVPIEHWAFSFIEQLAASGITGGCGNGNYCPEDLVTRAQMAVFLERGIWGSDFSPPAATGNVFVDVDASDFAASFIEQLFADGITSGCGDNNYCPNDSVTRAQMAVFLLRAKHGSAYSPPPPAGIFGDVDLSHWAVSWIEQLAAEGITAGCGNGNYCPEDAVTRAQMAVFLVRAFEL